VCFFDYTDRAVLADIKTNTAAGAFVFDYPYTH